ncbi:hypothetical protein SNE40_011586 [Patella caerulea]|uniref:BHLH domain-containing protein n=1 Tax=Patella caerulea TaxID=87958 RepID=A0AAN8JN11_PATCE
MAHCGKKPKMSKYSSKCIDDYEQFQPCFLNDDLEEFYTLNTPTPSEDIWKKFELLTPPRSPKREPYSDFNLDENTDIASFLDDGIFVNPISLALPFPETLPSNPSLQSKLIQDCMWSGSHKSNEDKIADTNIDVTSTSSDCVDPASVFPYPINDTKLHNLGTETPSDSEDEEVDVVSTGDEKFVSQAVQVDQQITSLKHQNCGLQTTTKCVNVKIEPKPIVVSNSDCAAISVHNYSLPYSHGLKRSRSTQSQSTVSQKRIKRELTEPMLKSVALKLKSANSSPDVSDSEESGEGKRTQHNVLERKRRNDLKDSFYVLRDNVPELDCKEKAPKVLILRKASEYIHSIRRLDVKYVKELNSLRHKNDMLRRKLESLQNEVDSSDEEYSIE